MPLIPLIGAGLALGSAISGSRAQGKANSLNQQALDMAKQQYAERAPFRERAMQMMQGVEGDTGLPADFGVNAGNPYARTTRVSTAMALPQAPTLTPLNREQRFGVAASRMFGDQVGPKIGSAIARRIAQQAGAQGQPPLMPDLIPLTGMR